MSVLVCGGAGYIGSHTVKELVRKYDVIVLDNLSTGFTFLLDDQVTFIKGDLGDPIILDKIFTDYQIDAVFHFAANSLVSESVQNPLKYYINNVQSTITLLDKMVEHKVNKFIFSSTAATYGKPDKDLIVEETTTNPINPYGLSKLMVEQILASLAVVYDFKYVVLRYFNAAGAHKSSEIGECHNPETHLIPIVLKHLLGYLDKVSIYGTDYETKDGTCIRDYIHVTDLANAHIAAYESLIKNRISNEVYNLGNGAGYSVKEIIEVCELVSGKEATVEIVPRRSGDPAILVASSEKAKRDLAWEPQNDLHTIIKTAWEWHRKESFK